jgi:hypothetical protein
MDLMERRGSIVSDSLAPDKSQQRGVFEKMIRYFRCVSEVLSPTDRASTEIQLLSVSQEG